MTVESELTISEHCDTLRLKVDVARETAIDNLHKASNTLMKEIDMYEIDCMLSWRAAKESIEITVGDVNKRMRAFLAEQQEYLQNFQASDA